MARTLARTVLSALALAALLPAQQPPAKEHDQTFALLWMQRAAEHHALCRQVFQSAAARLDEAIADPAWTACVEQRVPAVRVEDQWHPGLEELPLAVIADVDETVLDNTPFNARLIEQGEYRFDPAAWTGWCEERQALPVPGALAFCAEVQRRGITVFWITNRRKGAEEAATRDNLRALGFPVQDGELDTVLTRGEYGDDSADKGARRARVCATHRVLLLLGDDLNDFFSAVRAQLDEAKHDAASVARDAGAVEASRARRVEDFAAHWGTRWHMLPNPLYGSWEGLLRRQGKDLTQAMRTQRIDEKPSEPVPSGK